MILIPKKHNRYYAQKKASIQKDESHFIIGRIKITLPLLPQLQEPLLLEQPLLSEQQLTCVNDESS